MIGKTVSHYQILEKLGEGGMGEVYIAEDLKLERRVAIKFLPQHLTKDKENVERFEREAKAAAALNHPNIVTIYEIAEVDNQTFIVMEYIDGQSLKDKITERPLKLEEALEIAVQIATGLQKAHEKGIVHRDIKPANILISNDGIAKIVGFGLAKLSGQTKLTKDGSTLGTISYMSPEQTRGEKIDSRTDIWSLGVVLYEMLTGQLPFKGDYEQAMQYLIVNEEPEPLSGFRSGIPMEMERIVNRTLEKVPGKRYQRIEETIIDLQTLKKKSHFEQLQEKNRNKSIPSIAVLPLVNMSADPEQEYFCDGMAEEIINALTHIKGLFVVARTSAFSFRGKEIDVREIGHKLNVETLLEGSVRKTGNRLRITAQLINVIDGYHIWSERFDCEMKDVFAIQDEISLDIVDKLKVQLLCEEEAKIVKRHTEDPEAYNLYLKGLYFQNKWSEEGTKRGLEYIQKAIDVDPNFAFAYLVIADIYATIGVLSLSPPLEIFPKAKEMLNRALEIDDTLYEAHGVSSMIAFFHDWDWEKTEKEFQKALRYNPGYGRAHGGYAWYLAAMKRFDEAITEIIKAQELDPLLPLNYAWATAIYTYAGKFEEAIEQFHKAIELDPNMGLAYFHVGNNYMIQKKYREAFDSFQKAKEFTTGLGWAECFLGGIYHIQGKEEKATQMLNHLISQKKEQYISSLIIAGFYNFSEDKEKTFEWLEKAYQERDILMSLSHICGTFDNLSENPKFKALMRKMGLEK